MKAIRERSSAGRVWIKAYGKKFANDAERVAHLFDLYAYPPPQGAAKRSATIIRNS